MERIYASTSNDVEEREIIHGNISRELGTECMVLLENDGTLPLKGLTKAALFGAGARGTIKGGTGSGDVNTRTVVNIETGLEEAGVTVTTKGWLDRQEKQMKEQKAAYLAWVDEEAKRKGTNAFLVSFDHPYEEGAAADIIDEDVIIGLSRNGFQKEEGHGGLVLFNVTQ